MRPELTSNVAVPWLLDLLNEIPTPADSRRKRKQTVQRILETHRIRKFDAETVIRTLRKTPVVTARGVVEAASEHIRLACQWPQLVLEQIASCEKNMDAIYQGMSLPPEPGDEDEPGQRCEQRDGRAPPPILHQPRPAKKRNIPRKPLAKP